MTPPAVPGSILIAYKPLPIVCRWSEVPALIAHPKLRVWFNFSSNGRVSPDVLLGEKPRPSVKLGVLEETIRNPTSLSLIPDETE